MTYGDNRSIREYTVKTNEVSADGSYHSILTEEGTGFGTSQIVGIVLEPGTVFEMETINFSKITGFRVDGIWIERKSDEELAADHQKFVDDLNAKRREELRLHGEEWQAREDALPEWLKPRFATFHERGGELFKSGGWGYELIIAECAVILDEKGEEAANAFASEQGMSGNQFGFAQALVGVKNEGASTAETVSALTPLTGEPFYEAKEAGE